MQDFPDIKQLTALVRASAQQELVRRFERVKQQLKTDGSIITEADLAMQDSLLRQLAEHWPTIPFLGEEMPAEQQQQLLSNNETGLWVVDPLDGTTNFSLGIPFYAVSIALIHQGEIVLGLVYDPSRDECFHAIRGQGAYLNGQPLQLDTQAQIEKITAATIDFKRLPVELACRIVSDPPYKSQRSYGSVALDWCWFAAGRGDVYLHGRQNLWDYAAGLLVLQEAGGISSTLQGEPVYNGTLQPRSAVAAINPRLYERWYAFLTG